jgi:hypothetical protein
MAALAARRGQGGAAQAAGGGAEERSRPVSLTLLNPTWLLRLLYVLFWPVKFLFWLILPAVVLAGLTAARNWPALAGDHFVILREYPVVTLLLIGLFTVNLASRLAQGVAILAHGGRVKALGIMLIFGFVPRFFIDTAAIAGLDRRGQLWAHAAPVLARLGLFAVGMLTWGITRESGSWLPFYALIVGQFGLVMFVFSAMPLLPGDGQRWLSAYLDDPRLLPKAGAALRHLLTGRPLPPIVNRADLWPLALFALGTMMSIAAVVMTTLVFAAIWLEAEFGGLGVSVFLGMVGAFLLWLVLLRLTVGRRVARLRERAGQAQGLLQGLAGDEPAGDPMLGRVVDPAPRARAGVAARPPAEAGERMGARARVIWGVIAIGLLSVAFLPYDYEAGGPVEILPAARAQAVARTRGEIVAIHVAEGDVVAEGTPLAELSDWDQERAVAAAQADLAAAEARLAQLLAGAKPEEVDLARRRVESAEASLEFREI